MADGEIVYVTRADNSQLDSDLAAAEKKSSSALGKIGGVASTAAKIGGVALAGLGSAAIAVGTKAVTGAANLDAAMVCSKAALAESPPAANLADISSAFKPMAANPSAVVAEPSTTRMDISFTASPILSKLKAPVSAPFSMILNMSSASRPTLANCTEYSEMLSSSSPE